MNWLKRLFGSSQSQPCADAQERSPDLASRLETAIAKRDAAYARHDTRDYGRAIMELQQVNHDILRGAR